MPPSWVRSVQGRVAQAAASSKVPESLYHTDWSRSLANAQLSSTGTFSEGILAGLALPGEVSVMAFEPVLGYLAVGTTLGTVHLFGSPAVQVSFTLRPAQKVKFLAFKSGSGLLICIDEKDNMSIYDLERPDPQIRAAQSSSTNQYRVSSASTGQSLTGPPHPDTPQRIGVHTVRNKVMCLELSPSHSHMFLGLRDGTVDTYDLERLAPSPYRVPNLWWEEEEILRKSGVPDAPNRRHVPLIIDIKSHPKDINQLLLAYEGGAILLDVKEKIVLKTYQIRLLLGAPGAGGDPNLIWTERSSPATCVAWRPDGEVFALGHEDGCISFWHVKDDEKPLMVRTIEQLDVDKPQASMEMLERPRPLREPIFKLAWSGFPEKTWMEMASESAASWQGQPQGAVPATAAEAEEAAPTKGTVLTILGGAVAERDPPGLYCLHMPPYAAPLSSWIGGGADPQHKLRVGLAQSLRTTAESIYRTPSLVEDFILLPRINPHFSGNYDPMAILTLLAADPALPTLPPPAAARGLMSYEFPPRLPAAPPVSLSSPRISIPPPGPGISPPPTDRPTPSELAQKELTLPLPLTLAGSGALLGAKFEVLSPHAYRKLVGLSDITGLNQKQEKANDLASMRSSQDDSKAELNLAGGKASSSLAGEGSQTAAELAKSAKFRILVTWHLDGSVRFHDASPHLLLLGEVDEVDAADLTQTPRVWLKRGFPSPLPHLTISTRSLLKNNMMQGHPTFDRIRNRTKVQDVQFAPEVLEVGIALSTGQLLHYRFDFARLSETKAINEEVEQAIKEEELGAMIPPVSSPRSPGASFVGLGHRTDATAGALDNEMARAMQELDTDSAGHGAQPGVGGPAAPPPRPKRDPKRTSIFGRNRNSSDGAAMGASDSMGSLPEQPRPPPPRPPRMEHGGLGEEIIHLHHLGDWHCDGFKPNLMIDAMRGEMTAFAISDIGFLAIACGTVLAVLDLRSAELILREGFGDGQDWQAKEDGRDARKAMEAEGKSPISALTFTVCRVLEDPSLAPRLVVSRANGYTTIWSFQKTLDMWMPERTSGHKLDESAGLRKLEILDVAGNVCPALPSELQRALREQQHGPIGGLNDENLPDANLSLGFTDRGISLRFGITGPIISKAELNERVLGASVVDRLTDKAAVVVTSTSIRIFSLPRLEQITRLQRHHKETGEAHGQAASISFDGHGDFIEVCSSLYVRMWTIFGSLRRPGQPCLTLCPRLTGRTMPAHPGAMGSAAGVATSIAGWFGTKTSGFLSHGAHLDSVLAGPNRPEPPKLGDALPPRDFRLRTAQALAAAEQEVAQPTSSLQSARGSASKARTVAEQTNQARSTNYQNIDLLKARGAMMESLENGLSSLEREANSFVKNAKESAVKSAAKQKIAGFFS